MARVICVKPCVPNFATQITIPFLPTAVKSVANIDLKSDCSGCQLLASLFLQLNPFLMALGIPLCLLGCVTAIVAVVQAIPDSLGPPPDPTKLTSAIANVVKNCACVLNSVL